MALLLNRTCKSCEASFVPKFIEQHYCSECLDELHISKVNKKLLGRKDDKLVKGRCK